MRLHMTAKCAISLPVTDRLDLRLYFDPAYSEFAKAIGYAILPVSEAQQIIQKLAKRFPKEKLVTVVEEIAKIEPAASDGKEATVRLTDQAQKLCWQMLGPPPGHPDHAESPNASEQTEQAPKRKTGRKK